MRTTRKLPDGQDIDRNEALKLLPDAEAEIVALIKMVDELRTDLHLQTVAAIEWKACAKTNETLKQTAERVISDIESACREAADDYAPAPPPFDLDELIRNIQLLISQGSK